MSLVYVLAEAPESSKDGQTATGLAFDSDAVARITINREADTIVLKKEDGEWRVDQPVSDQGNVFVIDKLLEALDAVKEGQLLDGAVGVELGTEPDPAAKVTVLTESGQDVTFSIGDRAPVGWHAYLRTEDGRHFAVPGEIHSDIARSADSFRRRELFSFDMAAVDRVVLESREGTLDMTKGEHASWHLEGYSRVDVDKLENLLIALQRVNYDTFYHAELPNIDEPYFTIKVFEGEAEQRLVVGETTSMGRLALDRYGRAGFIAVAPTSFFEMGPTDIGVESPFDAGLGPLQRVRVQHGEQSRVIAVDGSEWTADDEAVSPTACLASLKNLAFVYRRLAPPVGEAPIGALVVTGEYGEAEWAIAPVDDTDMSLTDQSGGSPLRASASDLAMIFEDCGLATGRP